MKNKLTLWIMIVLIFIFTSSVPALALDNGNGGGKDEALALVESTPKDSDKGVALDVQIKLIFNKNVVNMTVKDNNSQCFTLKDKSNKVVAIDVIFADDQMEPDKKREIILKPKEALRENTTYRVEISSKLQAKNGTGMDKAAEVSFTTLGTSPQASKSFPLMYVLPVVLLAGVSLLFAAGARAKKRKP